MPFVAMEGIGENKTLKRGSQEVEVHATNFQIATNNIYGARAAAENGIGIADLPLALCEAALNKGTLVRLLPQWQLYEFALQAIWPDASRRSSLTTRLVKHIVAAKRPH